MLQNGVDVRTLQEVLGHEHLNTTQIYTHVDNDQLRTAAAVNPLGEFSPDENWAEKSPIPERGIGDFVFYSDLIFGK